MRPLTSTRIRNFDDEVLKSRSGASHTLEKQARRHGDIAET